MLIDKNTLKVPNSQFKEILNWLGINISEPLSGGPKYLAGNQNIKAFSLSFDSTTNIIYAFFKFSDCNGYDKSEVKRIIRNFLLSTIKEECSYIWAAAIPLYNEYILGGFFFRKDADNKISCKEVFCSDPQNAASGDYWKKFAVGTDSKIKSAEHFFERFQELFISDETAFKEYIEDYYEDYSRLPKIDELDKEFKDLIKFNGSYYNLLQKCGIDCDIYLEALKALCQDDFSRANVKDLVPKYFTDEQLKKIQKCLNIGKIKIYI